MPRIGIAGSYGSSMFSFLRNLPSTLLSVVAAPIHIPNSAGGFPFLHTLSSIYCSHIFDDGVGILCHDFQIKVDKVLEVIGSSVMGTFYK